MSAKGARSVWYGESRPTAVKSSQSCLLGKRQIDANTLRRFLDLIRTGIVKKDKLEGRFMQVGEAHAGCRSSALQGVRAKTFGR